MTAISTADGLPRTRESRFVRASTFTLFAMLAVILSATGCASMKSTMLNRNPDDSFSNNGHPTNGVPITVKVPTHLDIVIAERLYFYNAGEEGEPLDFKQVDFGPTTSRNLHIRNEIISTEKVMTVDFKRPAAGTMEYNLNFMSDDATDPTQNQYFSQIETMLYDRTLSDTADLVSRFVPGALKGTAAAETVTKTAFELGKSTSAGGIAAGGDIPDIDIPENITNYFIKDSVVAYQRFDLNDCDFEEQVQAFIGYHLSGCHDCCGKKVPDDMPVDIR